METDFITGGGPDRLAAAVALHGEIFKTDPVIQFLIHTMPSEERTAYIPELLGHFLKAASLNHAQFDEAWLETPRPSDAAAPACSAVWLTDGRTVDDIRVYIPAGFLRMAWNVGLSGCKRMMFDFQSATDKMKKQGLRHPDGSRIKQFDYLFFIGTAVDARGRGLSSELIRRRQVEAAKKGIPIWLESTTARSHRLYLKLGFNDVGEWAIGKGKVDANGHTKAGGEGVRIWAMLWWPEKQANKESEAASEVDMKDEADAKAEPSEG